MDIEKFTEELVRFLEEKTETNVQVRSGEVIKLNDTKLHAVNICPTDEHICRNFYAEAYFDEYQNGVSVETIAENILAYAKDEKMCGLEGMDWLSHIFEFEKVKDKITAKLISRERNREYLKGKCWMEYLDLALCFQLEVGNDGEGIMTVALAKDIFEAWGIPIETLFHIAVDNLKRLYSWQIIGLYELIENMVTPDLEQGDFQKHMNPPIYRETMFVATNEAKTNGAVCLLDKEAVKRLAEREGVEEVAVIPSSIHEMIFLPLHPEDKADVAALSQMVREVNGTQVRPDEILGDHVYIYSSADNEYHY